MHILKKISEKKFLQKDIIKIAWNVFLILICSRLFYLFIATAFQQVSGTDYYFADLFYKSDSEHYLNIAQYGYDLVPEQYGYANWAFFPLYPIVIRIVHMAVPFMTYAAVAIALSNLFVWVAGIYLVKYLRSILPDNTGYFGVFLIFFAPYTYFLCCIYTETLYVMLLAIFFYYLSRKNYLVAAIAAMFTATTRIAGVLLVFPLALQMYLDLCPGRISYRNLKNYIVNLFTNPVKLVYIMICPLGAFLNMLHLYQVTGDAWAFKSVQIAWREDAVSIFQTMKQALIGNDHAQRWVACVVVVTVGVYIYLAYKKHYAQALFGILAILVPLTGGLMSMCRFIMGSYVVFPAITEYLNNKREARMVICALCVFVEGVLIWLWFSQASQWLVV